jgi:hypothetical protein
MDPHLLIKVSDAAGVPAPYWFVQLFKVLGMTLHMVPMNLWYAGILLAMLLYVRGGEHARRFSARLMSQMPVIVALGVNLGIVPLLFLQAAYNKVFYPATIMMAWFWLSIIAMLIPAYYGVYAYSFGLRRPEGLSLVRRATGWLAALLFVGIGFVFANALSLMTRVSAWPELFAGHSMAGAALGTALNTSDATFWPRWLLMFGLALGTTAAWSLVEAAWFARRESDDYRRWVKRFATWLYVASFAWAAVAGSWYVLGTWSPEVRQTMFAWPMVLLTLVTGAAPALPLAWLVLRRGLPVLSRAEATWLGLGQVGVLAVNAVSRQIVQNRELRGFLDVARQPTAVQWSPLVVFLALFVAGLALVVWMLSQVVKAETGRARAGS